jgi:uncharacterized protein YcbK (DUF882 family)
MLSELKMKSPGVPRRINLNRRVFIKLGVLATVAVTIDPARTLASAAPDLHARKNLSLFNTHTAEHLHICYCRDGAHNYDAIDRISHLMRDHRTGEVKPIDTRVLDILYRLSRRLSSRGPLHIVSGYRSPSTNQALHKKSAGVASNSFHVRGMAVDFRLPNCKTAIVSETAVKLKAGGVGYYPKSDFVHVDCGPVRRW